MTILEIYYTSPSPFETIWIQMHYQRIQIHYQLRSMWYTKRSFHLLYSIQIYTIRRQHCWRIYHQVSACKSWHVIPIFGLVLSICISSIFILIFTSKLLSPLINQCCTKIKILILHIFEICLRYLSFIFIYKIMISY